MTASVLIEEFDTWQQGYGNATVSIFIGGTQTLASVFTDQALTQAAANPQTLLNRTDSLGNNYGKFAVPLYTGQPYSLGINSVDRTGVVGVPLTTLVGADASLATVIPSGGTVASNLNAILGRFVNVLDFGTFLAVGQNGASAVTNNNTLTAAIGAAAAAGGGAVSLPPGLFQFTQITLPTNVILVGQGRIVTTLQSTSSGKVVTVAGSNAGLRNCGIDGLSQTNGSIGLFVELTQNVILDNVLVQRFATGVQVIGGGNHNWRQLYISDCLNGYQGHGYTDSGNGGALSNCSWDGGQIDTCSTVGIEIQNVDLGVDHQRFSNLTFLNNTGIGFHAIGVRQTLLRACNWNGNTTDLQVEDSNPVNVAATNTIIGFDCQDSSFVGTGISGAAIILKGNLQTVAFRRCDFTNETITLTAPGFNVLAQDCRFISGVAFSGTGTAWVNAFTNNDGDTVVITTNASATPAWELQCVSGQRAIVKVEAVARSRNTTDSGFFKAIYTVNCADAVVQYNSASANFTAGNVLTGATSGATARIVATAPSGSTGTVGLQDITPGPNGGFQNGEVITDTGGGHALVASSVAPGTVSVGSLVNQGSGLSADVGFMLLRTDSNWTISLVAQGQNAVLYVTGNTNLNVEWFVNAKVLTTQQIL